MNKAFMMNYQIVMEQDKQELNFIELFGKQPADWFVSCQQEPTIFTEEGDLQLPQNVYLHHQLTEVSKGSVLHFHRYFPKDPRLALWAKQLGS